MQRSSLVSVTRTVTLFCCIGSCLIATALTSASHGGVIYTNPADFTIRGEWSAAGDNILVQPQAVGIDVNQDGTIDARIAHDFRLRENRFTSESAELMTTAINSLYESYDLLLDIRTQTLPATNEGLLNASDFAVRAAHVDNALDRMNRISENTRYNGRQLLNGASGVSGTASSGFVKVLDATADTTPGSYGLNVVQGAERATLLSDFAMTGPLDQDESLTVNGVTVDLFQNMSAVDVRDRINQFASHTRATASIVPSGADAGKLRLSTLEFGSRAQLAVISNVSSFTAGSSGFSDTFTTDFGDDIVVDINGIFVNGLGNVATIDTGSARGLSLQIEENWADPFVTVVGNQGVVTVTDNSLQLGLLPDGTDQVRVTLPDAGASALGIGVIGTPFPNLATIDVTSAARAKDSLEIIDTAIAEVREDIEVVEATLEHHYFPFGVLTVAAENAAELLSDSEGAVVKLTAGDVIDDQAHYGTDAYIVNEETFGGTTTGYFGVRLMVDEEYHYGWIRGTLGPENSLTIRDYSFESSAGTAIRAGFVPEPSVSWLGGLLAFAIACRRGQASLRQQR